MKMTSNVVKACCPQENLWDLRVRQKKYLGGKKTGLARGKNLAVHHGINTHVCVSHSREEPRETNPPQ